MQEINKINRLVFLLQTLTGSRREERVACGYHGNPEPLGGASQLSS